MSSPRALAATATTVVTVLGAVLFALAVAPPARGQDRPAPSREERVLALLRGIPVRGFHLSGTPLTESVDAHGCTVFAPKVLAMCGLGWRPAFDPELARRLGRELMAIYGLAPATDVAAPHGVAARLDSFDAAAGIGLELRGLVTEAVSPTGAPPTVDDEAADADLSIEEHRTLGAAGVRIHVADVRTFWRAASEDRFTTSLGYVASVVRFLDEVTDGEDVDLTAMSGTVAARFPFDPPKATAGVVVEPWPGGAGCTIECRRDAEVVLRVDPARAVELGTGKPITLRNDGRPVVLCCHGLSSLPGTATLLLRQRGTDRVDHELATGDANVLVAPGAFDLDRPFDLVLRLRAGSHRLGESLWVSGLHH